MAESNVTEAADWSALAAPLHWVDVGSRFVTAHPEMTSLLEFDEAAFVRHFGLIPGSEIWKQRLTATHRRRTRTRRADDLFRSEGLSRVDFLKLDTQGTELEALRGAHDYLSRGRISVIRTEKIRLPPWACRRVQRLGRYLASET